MSLEEARATQVASIGRVVAAVCVIAGCSMSASATLNYMVEPMSADLGLTSSQLNNALAIPSIASLLVVFLAGTLGDRLGQRRVLLVAVVVFTLGSIGVLFANGQVLLSLGLLLEGMAATVMSVVALGLLGSSITDDGQRANAFATYGTISPIIYLFLPLFAGWIIGVFSWRVVPGAWIVLGVLGAAATLFLLPKSQRARTSGELYTPLLAGLVLAAIVQTLSHLGDSGSTPTRSILSGIVALVSIAVLIAIWRRSSAPTLSITPLKRGATTLLLVVVLLVPFANTWYYLTLAFQYLMGFDSLQTAIAMVPAQIAGIIGAKLLAGPLMRRLGVRRSGVLLLGLLAIGLFSLLVIQADSPAWLLSCCAVVFGMGTVGAGVVITNAILSTAPPSESGNTSAYRSAASSIGVALGFIIMGSLVFGTVQSSLTNRLEAAGLDATQVSQEITYLQQSTQNPDQITQQAIPLPEGTNPDQLAKESMVDGLHVNSLVGGAVAVLAALLFATFRHRLPAREPGAR